MSSAKPDADATYLLSDLIGGKAPVANKAVGKLTDLIVAEHERLPRSPIC